MAFQASEEVTVSLCKNSPTASCPGVIINAEEDRLQVALRGPGLVMKTGMSVHLQPPNEEQHAAWASVEQVTLAGDVKLLDLKAVRYENECVARAARCQIDVCVSANFSDRKKDTKRAVGHTVNLSITGIRARFRSVIPYGTNIHALLHLENDKIVEAVAKAVRIVQGSESASGGYEVGLEFLRFIRGYEHLARLAPVGQEPPLQNAA